jgi:hypothetical protein
MTTQSDTRLPRIASHAEWLAASRQLLAKEKQLTRERDQLAAERRRLSLLRTDKPSAFGGAAVVVHGFGGGEPTRPRRVPAPVAAEPLRSRAGSGVSWRF